MDDLLQEFRHLISKLPGDPLAGSIELLLQQLEPGAARLLRLSAIPHQFTPEILQRLDPHLSAAQAERSCDEFARLSIIIARQDGLAMHDEARRYLFGLWLAPQNAGEFTAASARLVEHFGHLADGASGEALQSLERRRMFHLLGADQAQGFAEFERLFRHMRRQFRLSECESLVNLVLEYEPVLVPERAAWLVYRQGQLASDLRHWAQAQAHFDRVLASPALGPHLQVKTYNRLGILYAAQRDWRTAHDYYERALQLARDLPDPGDLVYRILHDLGTVYRDSGDLARANDFLEESIRLAEASHDLPVLAMAYNSLGTLYRHIGHTLQATQAYQKSLDYIERSQDRFRSAQVYNNLGVAFTDLRDWKKSEHYFQRSLEIKRQAGDTFGQAVTLNNLVQVYQNLHLHQEAIAASQQAIALFGEMRDVYNMASAQRNLARLHSRMKNVDLARRAFGEAIELFERSGETAAAATREELHALDRKKRLPGCVWLAVIAIPIMLVIGALLIVWLGSTSYAAEGDAFLAQGAYRQAIESYQQAIEINPEDAVAYNNRGLAYYYLQQYDHALDDYAKAIQLDAGDINTYLNRSLVYIGLGQHDRALADIETALQLDPRSAAAYNNRGLVYNAQQQYDRALSEYNQAVALDPRSAITYTNRGWAYYHLQQLDQALADFSHAIDLHSGYAWAYHARGSAYMALKNFDRALQDYDQAIELLDGEPLFYSDRGLAHTELDQYALAMVDLDRAIELFPDNPWFYSNRGWVHHLQDDREKAKADYLRHLDIQEDSFPLVSLAVLYWQENDPQQARRYFQRALRVAQAEVQADPYFRGYLLRLAISQLALGQTQTGLDTFRRAADISAGLNINHSLKNLQFLQQSPQPIPGVDQALHLLSQLDSQE